MKRKGADYHHGDLRRALVEATLRLVAEHGTDGFTLRAAAKLAGVSDGAPYHHFSDKEALVAFVAEEGFDLLAAEMKSRACRQPGSERSKHRAACVAYVLFAAKNPSRFRIMCAPIAASRKHRAGLVRAAKRTYQDLHNSLARGLRNSSSRPVPKDMFLAAWGLVHGLASLAAEGYLGSDGKDEKRLSRIVWGAMRFVDRGHEMSESIPNSGSRSRAHARVRVTA